MFSIQQTFHSKILNFNLGHTAADKVVVVVVVVVKSNFTSVNFLKFIFLSFVEKSLA